MTCRPQTALPDYNHSLEPEETIEKPMQKLRKVRVSFMLQTGSRSSPWIRSSVFSSPENLTASPLSGPPLPGHSTSACPQHLCGRGAGPSSTPNYFISQDDGQNWTNLSVFRRCKDRGYVRAATTLESWSGAAKSSGSQFSRRSRCVRGRSGGPPKLVGRR